MRTPVAIAIVLVAGISTGAALAFGEDEALLEAIGARDVNDEDVEAAAKKTKKKGVFRMEVGNPEHNPVVVNVPTAASQAVTVHNDGVPPKKQSKGDPGRVDKPE